MLSTKQAIYLVWRSSELARSRSCRFLDLPSRLLLRPVFFVQKQLLMKQQKEAALAAKEQQMAEQRSQIVKAKVSALKLATVAASKACTSIVLPYAQAQSRVRRECT